MAFQDVEPEESSEFRNESFVDTIESLAYNPKQIGETIRDMITFKFEDGAPLDFFEPDDWATVKNFSGIGRIISDLKKSGIKFQVDPEAQQIRTVPSVIGARVSFKCTKNEKIVRGEVKTYTNWNIDTIELPDGNENKATENTEADDKELLGQVMKDIEIILKGHPEDMRGIIRGYSDLVKDREVRLPRLRLKDRALDEMINVGIV